MLLLKVATIIVTKACDLFEGTYQQIEQNKHYKIDTSKI